LVRAKNIENYKQEKKGLIAFKKKYPGFIVTDKDNVKIICDVLGVNPKRYHKTFDGILLNDNVDSINAIKSHKDFKLIELKNTQGSFVDFPNNTFLGLTQNEHDFLKIFYTTYFLCIYHTEKDVCSDLINIVDFEKLTRTDENRSLFRTQYQVKFKPYNDE
tara:strand:+ start:53 stop:535 length:483 start_codon:yes stop_codon:yes gene_type:complete